MTDERITVGVVRKVNLGNYESEEVSVYITGLEEGSSPDAIAGLIRVGEMAFDAIKTELEKKVAKLKEGIPEKELGEDAGDELWALAPESSDQPKMRKPTGPDIYSCPDHPGETKDMTGKQKRACKEQDWHWSHGIKDNREWWRYEGRWFNKLDYLSELGYVGAQVPGPRHTVDEGPPDDEIPFD
jgi:hypothetical protein